MISNHSNLPMNNNLVIQTANIGVQYLLPPFVIIGPVALPAIPDIDNAEAILIEIHDLYYSARSMYCGKYNSNRSQGG